MRDEEKWKAIHLYRTAVANGDAPPILCPEDQSELLPRMYHDTSPCLHCFTCRTTYVPGSHVWNQIEAAIHELHDELTD